jgi:hypothetical protein
MIFFHLNFKMAAVAAIGEFFGGPECGFEQDNRKS